MDSSGLQAVEQESEQPNIKKLLDAGQFLKAIKLAEETWGPHQSWKEPAHLLLGGRLFANLGFRRKAMALRFKLWRNNREHPEAIYYYVYSILNRKGPLKALLLLKKFGNLDHGTQQQQARWFALHASVYGQYRDWEKANYYIEEAKKLSPNDPWINVEHAYLFEEQDEYHLAWNEIKQLVQQGYRPAVQYGAYLKTLEDNKNEAIEILESHLMNVESISIALQLFRIYQEANQWPSAITCFNRAESLIPGEDKTFSEDLSIAAFDIAYNQGDLEKARKALANIKSPFFKIVNDNLEKSQQKIDAKKLEVPFVRQHHMTCAPATLTSIAYFWDKEINHLDIVEDICYDGTPNHAERRWAKDQGWAFKEFELEPETAFSLIDRGIPFTLSTVAPGSAHLQAIIGYDKTKGVYYVRDPYYPSVQEFLIDGLGNECKSTGPRCLALVPKDQEKLLSELKLPASELYDAYFELIEFLEQHQYTEAKQQVEKMRHLQTDHRLTLTAERTLSRYEGDRLKELELVEKLLLAYPGDLNLQTEKSFLLSGLGRYQEQIDYLEQKTKGAYPHPFIVESLANCLRHDNRNAGRLIELLSYVLYRQPKNAAALWVLANVHWDQERYDQGFEYYRLCTTLEDKNEGYFSSYFMAARYLKRTDEAVNNLKQRVKDFGHKSYAPHESLYFAYDALARDQEALDVLKAAIKLHPEDAALLKRLIRAYVFNGMMKAAESLLAEKKKYLSKADWLQLSATLAKQKNDWQREQALNEAILKLKPLDYATIEAQAILLGRHQGDSAAIEFLNSKILLNENDRALLFMKQDWLYDQPYDIRENFARKITEVHPRDYQAFIRLAKILQDQQKLEEAELNAKIAYDINPYNTEVLITLGDIYKQQNCLEKAKTVYKRTIEYWVDTDGVFTRFLQCCESQEEKRRELGFIHSELMKQTSYGNGILEYVEVARDLIKDEQLLEFLEQALAIRPDLWHVWVALSTHLCAMNQLQRAIQVASEGVEKFPLLPRLWFERANIYYAAQAFDKAEQDLKEALKLSPQWMSAITRLADTLEVQKKYDEALELLEHNLVSLPNSSVLHGYLADFKANTGEHEQALQHLEKALALNPQYEWGWDRYKELAKQQGLTDGLKQLALKLLEKEPKNTTILRKVAEVEEDYYQKLKHINKALCYNPKNEDINLAKCRIYFQNNEISKAKKLIHEEKWNGNPPACLLAFEAWMEAEFQRYDQAIAMMKAVVDQYPYYYDGWRLLSRWTQKQGQYLEAVKYVDNCVRLHPHAADVLTMAAEAYIEAKNSGHDINESAIDEYLKKALILNPRDQYNALTWLDYLIEEKDLESLSSACEIIQYDENNPYYLVRFLQTAILEGDIDRALKYFTEIVKTDFDNEWLFITCYTAFNKSGLQQQLYAFLKEQIRNKAANPLIGLLWVQYCIDNEKSSRKLVYYLEYLNESSPQWFQAMEAVLMPKNKTRATPKIIRKYRKLLQENARLWDLVSFYYSNLRQWKKLRGWCKTNWRRDQNAAWAVYLYGYGLRLNKQWQKAAAVNSYAATLPADDYYDRITLWIAIDKLLANRKNISEDDLSRIRYPELSALEQYAYHLLIAMSFSRAEGGLLKSSEQVVKALNTAKITGQDVLASSVAQILKRRARQFLNKQVQGNLWQTISWRLRLLHLM